jgi:hypothetical protein
MVNEVMQKSYCCLLPNNLNYIFEFFRKRMKLKRKNFADFSMLFFFKLCHSRQTVRAPQRLKKDIIMKNILFLLLLTTLHTC